MIFVYSFILAAVNGEQMKGQATDDESGAPSQNTSLWRPNTERKGA